MSVSLKRRQYLKVQSLLNEIRMEFSKIKVAEEEHNAESLPARSVLRRRFGLFLTVIGVVISLGIVKVAVHWVGWEFLNLNALFTSVIAGAVFIIGFLLSSILSDYKEAERIPAEMRAALEAIYDDCRSFLRGKDAPSITPLRDLLIHIVKCLPAKLEKSDGRHLRPVIGHIDELTNYINEMESAGMPPNYIVRLRSEQSTLRRSVFRMYQMQRIQFVPSVHVLVQSLVVVVVCLLLFLKTEGSPESALIFGTISYLFIYVLYLIATLEQPFRKGRHTFDDVSLFLLREFEAKLLRRPTDE